MSFHVDDEKGVWVPARSLSAVSKLRAPQRSSVMADATPNRRVVAEIVDARGRRRGVIIDVYRPGTRA